MGADAGVFEEDACLTAIWLWTLKTGDTNGAQTIVAEVDSGEDEEGGGKKGGAGGFAREFDAARKIAQGLGAHLEGKWGRFPFLNEIGTEDGGRWNLCDFTFIENRLNPENMPGILLLRKYPSIA